MIDDDGYPIQEKDRAACPWMNGQDSLGWLTPGVMSLEVWYTRCALFVR